MDFKYEESRIYLENEKGECIAEVTFPKTSENKVIATCPYAMDWFEKHPEYEDVTD